MSTDLQRLHALILLHYPSLAAFSKAMGRYRHWAARRVSDSAGAPVELTVAELGEVLTKLGEPAARLAAGAPPILAEGDADLLDYLGAHRRRSAALQRTTAADLDRLELQGIIRAGRDYVVITADGLRVLATLRGAAVTACETCHGYGTADGEPAGNLPRDTYADPGPCPVCEGTGQAPGCARHGGQCDGSDRGCTDTYPCDCGAGEVEP